MEELFKIKDTVRDYECDLQGIVNNSVYQNYLEHARHEFLFSRGIDFSSLARKGINLVVVRVELDYKNPLRPRDSYSVSVVMHRISKIRIGFTQEIRNISNDSLAVSALVIGTCLNKKGKPDIPSELDSLLLN